MQKELRCQFQHIRFVIKKNTATIHFGVNIFQWTKRTNNSKIFLNRITNILLRACQILILRSVSDKRLK